MTRTGGDEDYGPSSLSVFSTSVNQFLKEGKYPILSIMDNNGPSKEMSENLVENNIEKTRQRK